MHHHSQLCKLVLDSVSNDDQEEESNINDNGKDDEDFVFG